MALRALGLALRTCNLRIDALGRGHRLDGLARYRAFATAATTATPPPTAARSLGCAALLCGHGDDVGRSSFRLVAHAGQCFGRQTARSLGAWRAGTLLHARGRAAFGTRLRSPFLTLLGTTLGAGFGATVRTAFGAAFARRMAITIATFATASAARRCRRTASAATTFALSGAFEVLGRRLVAEPDGGLAGDLLDVLQQLQVVERD